LPEECKLFYRQDLTVPVKKRIKRILKHKPDINYISKQS